MENKRDIRESECVIVKKKEICRTCCFYEYFGNAGYCHRFPPNQDGNGKNSIDEPPCVSEDSWCGEHKK